MVCKVCALSPGEILEDGEEPECLDGYWIVNLVDECVEVYWSPVDQAGYVRREAYRKGDAVPVILEGQ